MSGWENWVSGYAPGKSPMNTLSAQFFKNMVFEDQNWDFTSLNIQRDVKVAEQKLGSILNATNPDLRAFRRLGGKLIIYHGWNDAAIPAEMSIDYYKSVARKMGSRISGEFLRLYMVPGMHHCAEGPGPNRFGQNSGCLSCDAKQDINVALEQWVEKGIAPDSIIATKHKDEFRQTGIVRTRPLCPYPQVARYKGSGSIDDAENFACVKPNSNGLPYSRTKISKDQKD